MSIFSKEPDPVFGLSAPIEIDSTTGVSGASGNDTYHVNDRQSLLGVNTSSSSPFESVGGSHAKVGVASPVPADGGGSGGGVRDVSLNFSQQQQRPRDVPTSGSGGGGGGGPVYISSSDSDTGNNERTRSILLPIYYILHVYICGHLSLFGFIIGGIIIFARHDEQPQDATSRLLGGLGIVQVLGLVTLMPPFLMRGFRDKNGSVFVGMWHDNHLTGHLKYLLDATASNTSTCVWDNTLGPFPRLCPILARVVLCVTLTSWMGLLWKGGNFGPYGDRQSHPPVYIPLLLGLCCGCLYAMLALKHLSTSTIIIGDDNDHNYRRRKLKSIGEWCGHHSLTFLLVLIWFFCNSRSKFQTIMWWLTLAYIVFRTAYHFFSLASEYVFIPMARNVSWDRPSVQYNDAPLIDLGYRIPLVLLDGYIVWQWGVMRSSNGDSMVTLPLLLLCVGIMLGTIVSTVLPLILDPDYDLANEMCTMWIGFHERYLAAGGGGSSGGGGAGDHRAMPVPNEQRL